MRVPVLTYTCATLSVYSTTLEMLYTFNIKFSRPSGIYITADSILYLIYVQYI